MLFPIDEIINAINWQYGQTKCYLLVLWSRSEVTIDWKTPIKIEERVNLTWMVKQCACMHLSPVTQFVLHIAMVPNQQNDGKNSVIWPECTSFSHLNLLHEWTDLAKFVNFSFYNAWSSATWTKFMFLKQLCKYLQTVQKFCNELEVSLLWLHLSFSVPPMRVSINNSRMRQLISIVSTHPLLRTYGGCGGSFLACKDFGRMLNHSFPACAFFFFFLKWRLARAH